MSQNNLKSLKIQIQNDSAYILKTPGGSKIRIQPGTFKTDPGAKVEIEIKEALSATDILLAGLVTTSNGKTLSSGGMLYFSARAENKELEFNKQVSISVPTEKYDDGMQLFKGEMTEDSSINWVEPEALDTSAYTAKLKLGEQLFKSNCANCHKVNDDFTGPALSGYSTRIPGGRKWIYAFIKNPSVMIERDAYAKWIAHKWKPTIMTAFPNLNKNDIDAIMDYVDNETNTNSSTNSMPATSFPDTSLDNTFIPACGYDTTFYNTIINSNNDEILNVTNSNEQDTLMNGFNYNTISVGIYSFNIEANGWYNIDRLFEEEDKLETVKLTAIIKENKDPGLEVYLLIPGKKIMISSIMNRNNEFSFSKEDGMIELPLNEEGLILAIGSDSIDCFYGIKSFRLQQSQQIEIELKKETPDKIKEAIRNNKLEDVQIEPVKKTKDIIPRPCGEGWNNLLLVAFNTTSSPLSFALHSSATKRHFC